MKSTLADETKPVALNVVTGAVRAWTEPARTSRRSRRRKKPPLQPVRNILIVDIETTIDPRQSMTFGGWCHARVNEDGSVTRLAEGLVYADDLPTSDPDGYARLVAFARSNVADVDPREWEADRVLRLSSRTKFIEGTVWKLAYKAHAHLVMFNKPFDLSRLAIHAAPARGHNYGAFSLQLWGNELYRPRVRVKHIDSKKSLASFGIPQRRPDAFQRDGVIRGNFLDLRTWAFALTNRSLTLRSACEMFGVEHGKLDTAEIGAEHGHITNAYIGYLRRDVLATTELFEKLYAEHRLHPIELEPTQAFSTASVAKSYLYAMGLVPRLERDNNRITPKVLAACMEAFYGGRAEVRIRHQPVPVELHDFTSMYPSVNALMGLWPLLTADAVRAVSAKTNVQHFLNTVTLESMFDPESWPHLAGIAEVAPDGDILPVRAKYDDRENHTIGVNPVWSARPAWYTIADLVASKLLTGRTPQVLRAYRFTGSGRLDTLRPTQLRGTVRIDPRTEDFFVRVVEQRQIAKRRTKGHPETCGCRHCRLSAFLKTLANSGSYGIFSELNGRDRPPEKPDTVRVFDGRGDSFTRPVPGLEVPGHMCFPPIATCITGAARLMLALLERCVTDAGGSWAFCDTDSLAVVATADGRDVPCQTADGDVIRSLSYATCESIRQRFLTLSPYDPTIVPELLKPECRASCLAVSAKRYALYTLDPVTGAPDLVPEKYSEHGLGHLLNPADPGADGENKTWIAEYWTWRISTQLDIPAEPPAWLDRPAVGSFTVSSPHLWRAFRRFNQGTDYRGSIKPFSFMLVAYLSTLNTDDLLGGRLIAPYESDASKWETLDWLDLNNPQGPTYRLVSETTPSGVRPETGMRLASAKSLRNIVSEHWKHPEAKFLGPDGQPCHRDSTGLLQRRPTVIAARRLIGKESNRLDAVEGGVSLGDPTMTYAEESLSATAKLVLSPQPWTVIARELDDASPVSVRTLRRWHAGQPVSDRVAQALTSVAAQVAAAQLDAVDNAQHRRTLIADRDLAHPERVLLEWAHRIGGSDTGSALTRVCGCGCGTQVTGRARYATATCRKRVQRNRKTTK